MKRTLGKALAVLIALNALFLSAGVLLRLMIRDQGGPTSANLALGAILGGKEFRSIASGLTEVRLVVYGGGAEIDLSGASLAPEGARVVIFTVMGGVEIIVPDNARVVVSPHTFMGGTVAPPPPAELTDDAPVLQVDAVTVMGGLDISYARLEEARGASGAR